MAAARPAVRRLLAGESSGKPDYIAPHKVRCWAPVINPWE